MIFASSWHELVPLAVIALAAVAYGARQVLELTGRAPGAELLRVENNDLARRNNELEHTIERLREELEILRRKVADLEKTNQAAVLAALKEHEVGAKERHTVTVELLGRAVAALEQPPS